MPMPVISTLPSSGLKPSYSSFVDFEPRRHQAIPLCRTISQDKLTVCHHEALSRSRYTSMPLSSLRPGSKFEGVQASGRTEYPFTIDVKSADILRSTFSGYLNIKNLTPEITSLTTYFDAEIIGPHHSFKTSKWGADSIIDYEHWSKFPAFEQFKDKINDESFIYDHMNSEFIFMRWKEHFLVPDHKVRNMDGVSFTGFYYVCFQVTTGEISGFYFHPQASDWFQKLTLTHVIDNQFPEFEFR